MASRAEIYRISPLAESDLENIWLYTVENWSTDQADLYIGDILRACASLASGLKSGREVDIRDGYFKYPVGSHFIFCRKNSTGIDVIRVLHQRMDASKRL